MLAQVDVELVSALMDGAFDAGGWRDFVDRIRLRTDANHAAFVFRRAGALWKDLRSVTSGPAGTLEEGARYLREYYPTPPAFIEDMEEGRPYNLHEWLASFDPTGGNPCRDILGRAGHTAFREILVREPSGMIGVLNISRTKGDFAREQERLLEEIVPLMRRALGGFAALERERFRHSVTARGAAGARLGWLGLGENGAILDSDPFGKELLSNADGLGRNAVGNLTVYEPGLRRQVYEALAHLAKHGDSPAISFQVERNPSLDMVLVSAGASAPSDGPKIIAYLRRDAWEGFNGYEEASRRFGLAPREAKLALALCAGMTLGEAAARLGLSVETARNYSKAIYAKTQTRGQTDLVRLLMGSSLPFRP